MAERLSIRDFGPIRSADIEVRNLTIFVGPQATGKSLAAQALFFLNSIQDFLDVVPPEAKTPTDVVLSAMEWWFGNKPSIYSGQQSLLLWEPTLENARQKSEIRWRGNSADVSPALAKQLLTQRERPKSNLSLSRVYIPGGRTLYSFLPPYSRALSSRSTVTGLVMFKYSTRPSVWS